MRSFPKTTKPLNRAEIKRLCNYEHEDYRRRAWLVIQFFTGARLNEMISLRWRDLIDQDYIVFHTSKQDRYQVKKGKKKKKATFRRIKITTKFRRHINSIYEEACSHPDRYIFESFGRGDTHISENTPNNWLKTAFRDCKVKTLNDSTHALRKSFGRIAYENLVKKGDVDALFKVQAMYGHSSVIQTMTYIGLVDEKIDDAYESVDYD